MKLGNNFPRNGYQNGFFIGIVRTELSKKNPHSQGLRGFKGGPTWTRTVYVNC